MRSFTAIIALLAAAATAASPTDRPPALEYTARALKDEVHDLPGAPANPGFRQFAGYIDVGHGRSLFYTFARQTFAASPAYHCTAFSFLRLTCSAIS